VPSIALGSDPLLTLAASAPLPPYADRLTFAGFLRRSSVELAAGRSIDTLVPADAEIILECLVNPERAFADAPAVATSAGFLSGAQSAVVATVTALTHRANPVLPVIVLGRPLGEEGVIARAIERLLLPLARLAIPELVDLRLPESGAHRHIAFASIRKTFPMQARRVMNALWGLGRLSTIKMLVVVDADVDLQNDDDVWFAVGAHSHPGRDTIFSEGPADMLDHAAPVRGVGHRIGIDATRKSDSEGHQREWPADLKTDTETARLVSQRWQQYGISQPGDSTR
jgi:4-hydroxy-3-polyprenylbenzoate decarboxylase